jgi:hypothetical protein
MKTTSFGLLSFFSLILVIIVLPMHVQNDNRLRAQERVQENVVYYDGALRAAVQDAGVALASNERQIRERDVRYESEKKFRPDKELAVETFFRTLHVNFDIVEDPLAQELLHRYIPAVSVIDYDGFWVYADDEFDNAAGEMTVKPVWYAKKPYAYADRFGNSLSFTLDDYVYAYDAATQSWHQGQRGDVNAETGGRIALLGDADTFDQVRRLTIVQTIQSELEHYINDHNERTRRLGYTYTFTLPTISQEE